MKGFASYLRGIVPILLPLLISLSIIVYMLHIAHFSDGSFETTNEQLKTEGNMDSSRFFSYCSTRCVPVTLVTRLPRVKNRVLPQHTGQMIEKKVSGDVRVQILIDASGRVLQARPLNDLGYGSAEKAIEAVKKMAFYPAYRGLDNVAVWITVPVNFSLSEKVNCFP